jgi:UDP-glucose 4-epimerase
VHAVLVTGGAGFIGANLVRSLVESGVRVRVLDDLSVGRLDYLNDLQGDLEFRRGTIEDARAVSRAVRGMDAVVHLAALSGVAPSVARPERDFRINVVGTFNVLDAARRTGCDRVVFASSGATLAGARPPLHEGLLPAPLSPYGVSKLYGEAALQGFAKSFGIAGIALRFSNVYGPFSLHKQSVVPTFLRRAVRKRSLVIYGAGRQTRDFLYVDDVVEAIRRALKSKAGGTLQLGSGDETSVLALARLVMRVTGTRLDVERRPPRSAEAHRNYSDISLVQRVLRWQPHVGLQEGLTRCYRWFLDQDVARRQEVTGT